jgi:hypothetical protein
MLVYRAFLMRANRTQFWPGALLVVIVAVLGCILLRPNAAARRVSSYSEGRIANPDSDSDVGIANPNSHANPANERSTPNYEQIKAEREQKLQRFFNAPIDFYGKVVDENDQPISGASTHYIVASASFYGSPTLDGPQTDAKGFFSITGKRGPRLSVWVEHPRYHKTDSAHQRIEYARGEYMAGKEPPPPPTKENPAIFVLHKKGIAEPLIRHQEIKRRLPFNGNPIGINLRTGGEGQDGESIIIALQSEGDKVPINTFRPFNWSLTIQVLGGGLVERLNALDFQAPADGYRPQIVIEMPAFLPEGDWKSEIQQEYFVAFGSGSYGRVRLDISGLKGRCIAETYLNPKAGSRNLEFDPGKLVQAP